METKISVSDEKHLTRAIEKAATIATVNDSLDRNELLANQLKAEGVDCRFAKVASAAFNKRITVLTFQKTADEHRAEPFALTDDSKVYELMGGETQTKTASATTPAFRIGIWTASAPMNKTASAYRGKPCYEDTVDCDTFKEHIESVIEKHSAEFSKLAGLYESLQSKVKCDAEDIASYFQKDACRSFEFTTAVNVYGDAFENVMKDYLPESVSFAKTAFAVKPGTAVFRKIDTLIKEAAALKDLEDFICYYGKGLAEFSKTASALGNFMAKAAFHGLLKEAGLGAINTVGNIALRSALTAGLNAKDNVHDVLSSTGKSFNIGMQNALNMYNAGNVIGMAPNDVLDAEFLIKDRFRDRLMGWSDMSADPQFAMYPAEQVFAATQKAMDTDSSLERPDRREVLRTTVGQLLAQNNRFSTADVAALSTTLKNLTGTGGNASNIAASAVSSDKITGTEKPVLNNMLDALPEYKRTDVKGMIEDTAKYIEERRKEHMEERAAAIAAAADAEEAERRAKQEEEQKEQRYADRKQKELDKEEAKKRQDQLDEERRQSASDYQKFQERERQKDRDAAAAAAADSNKTYRQALAIQARLARKGLGSFNIPQPPSTPSFDTSSNYQNTGNDNGNGNSGRSKEPKQPKGNSNIHPKAWTDVSQAVEWAKHFGFSQARFDDTAPEGTTPKNLMSEDYNQGAYQRAQQLGLSQDVLDAYIDEGYKEYIAKNNEADTDESEQSES